ncbi:TrmH family RNA methyltransferase [Chitinophaga barathri]|uniref:RNA methyltransferase n=1 Tax=Chitinophaga barathri TaxID=1647451 RepID=A0A3N4MAN7_9BACT|nr:RNA methyltransferase [Chitinophaga barathri]RPD40842.1 RNA methyltransferase [Chitinophaga barathri]
MLSKAQIKYIVSLQHKKYRQKFGQFVAEGDKIVQELLQDHRDVKAVFATREWLLDHRELAESAAAVDIQEVEPAVLKQLSSLSTPNQALALVNIPKAPPLQMEGAVTLALETIQDPGNMGTIIRIADWFGIRQIVCSPDSVDAYNAKTIQATMGSIMRVPVIVQDIPALLDKFPKVASYAATLHGDNIIHTKTIREGIILVGNESRGLSEEVLKRSSHHITIPRTGHAESLNAAVATGIICGRLLI